MNEISETLSIELVQFEAFLAMRAVVVKRERLSLQ